MISRASERQLCRWTIGRGPGRAAAEDAVRAVGQGRLDRALLQPAVDPVEDAREAPRQQMREQPAAGGETAVGGDEMTPAGLLVHGALGGGFGAQGRKPVSAARRTVS